MPSPTNALRVTAALLLLAASSAFANGKLGVTDAWIRVGPPGASMVAGYATLKNEGDAPVSVLTVQSDTFRDASIHETVMTNDVARMRELHRLNLEPGESVKLEPGGKHLMLMQPRHDIAVGQHVEVTFLLRDGQRVDTQFEVVGAAASGD
jgi:copper(I)-binding protein